MFIMFFALAMTLLLEPFCAENQTLDSIGYIQNIRTETVVLVSNNILNGEITSAQEKNNQNFSSSSPLILVYNLNKSSFGNNKTLLKGDFIHNISISNQNIYPIRAP